MTKIDRKKKKQRILVADDSVMNRELLIEMLQDQYELLEAENGREAVEIMEEEEGTLSLLLLDLVMPEMGGFEVLEEMQRRLWIEEIPVIVISAETDANYIDRAYEYGVTDFVTRPFNMAVVRHRVENAMLLFEKQRKMTSLIIDQLYKNRANSRMMTFILSHIVEFRNGESGMHVLHINTITQMLLQQLRKNGNPYGITVEQAEMIVTAASLHDVGKITVPDEVLNKPGKLTPEEFEIMRTHSMKGAEMMRTLPEQMLQMPLVQTAYEICRWHHERFDGKGYPDGLAGEKIPISAQVVSLADVYDALTSERCYKKAFTHETAMNMIIGGECGIFNPRLLDCLVAIGPDLQEELQSDVQLSGDEESVSDAIVKIEESGLVSEHMINQVAGLSATGVKRLQKLETAVRSVADGDLNISLSVGEHDEIGKLTRAFIDMVQKLKSNLLELNDRVYRDGLTSVRNRQAYQNDVAALDKRIHNEEEIEFGLVVLDINCLKYINNTHGHDLGDALIIRVCRMICDTFQHSPVYRIGGDEFAVILQNTDFENRDSLMEQFREVMLSIECGDVVLKMPASAGLSVFDKTLDHCFGDVFRRADALMYQNKMEIKQGYAAGYPERS